MSDNILVPDGITPVVGWRIWNVAGSTLSSVNDAHRWPARQPMTATCPIEPTKVHRVYIGGVGPGQYVDQPVSEDDQRAHRVRLDRLHFGYPAPTWSKEHKCWGTPSPQYGEWIVLPEPRLKEKVVPAEGCTCGIYAANNLDATRSYLPQSYSDPLMRHGRVFSDMGTRAVVGRVALWGRVVVHDTGWRGQYAYPQALYVADMELKKRLADYGVPVLPVSEIQAPVEPPDTSMSLATGGVMSVPQAKRFFGLIPL